MKNENNKLQNNQVSPPALPQLIQQREAQIEQHCAAVAFNVNRACELAFEQGDDLTAASRDLSQHDFAKLIDGSYGVAPKRAYDYMKLAAKVPRDQRQIFFNDTKQLKLAMHTLDLLPEPTPSAATGRSVSIAPIFERLTWLAEWTNKNRNEVSAWPTERKQDLKQQLAPVVELWETL